jgi:hypothetical protein
MVDEFLASQGVIAWRYARMLGAWKLGIGRAESVRKAASAMLPFVFKKREELKAIVDYLESRITGTQFAGVLSDSVRIGNRTGRIRIVDIPYTRRDGQRLRKEEMRENIVRCLAQKRATTTGVVDQIGESVMRDGAINRKLIKGFHKQCKSVASRMVND